MWNGTTDTNVLTMQDVISVLLNYSLPAGISSEVSLGILDHVLNP